LRAFVATLAPARFAKQIEVQVSNLVLRQIFPLHLRFDSPALAPGASVAPIGRSAQREAAGG